MQISFKKLELSPLQNPPQMEAFFLRPLRKLQSRLCGCPPLSFVIDALDERTSEPELTDLIVSLARALREPDLPVTHILLTSRPESHISKVFQNNEVRLLVRDIPVTTSWEGGIISLDGSDFDRTPSRLSHTKRSKNVDYLPTLSSTLVKTGLSISRVFQIYGMTRLTVNSILSGILTSFPGSNGSGI
ncbi:hypothetical protein DFJ58DRAFT_723308 [Suillus subalutaceus]|uniref:uncharacterized protein n=1 Tax=Suillus subalutaceus TaxID=48586 RepID=UPI001B87F383|nr:uncharacterized protein DFJ58DRAFT_723308 [Suillus subalutaceus]KAG1869447.1 hypothetical protein DFJ58DRAFT_723308 [Suillus subalutaceus]